MSLLRIAPLLDSLFRTMADLGGVLVTIPGFHNP